MQLSSNFNNIYSTLMVSKLKQRCTFLIYITMLNFCMWYGLATVCVGIVLVLCPKVKLPLQLWWSLITRWNNISSVPLSQNFVIAFFHSLLFPAALATHSILTFKEFVNKAKLFFIFLSFFLEYSRGLFLMLSFLLLLSWWHMLLQCVLLHLKQVFFDLKSFKFSPFLVQLGIDLQFCDFNNVFLVFFSFPSLWDSAFCV